jgi:hypothetical protein
MKNFILMFGDNEETWNGGEFDTLVQASEVGHAFDGGYATGYQIYDEDGNIVEEDYIDSEEYYDNDFDPDGRRSEKPWDYGKHFDDEEDFFNCFDEEDEE